MKKKVSLFKKISLYLSYRKILLKNVKEFNLTYNLRIDNVNRIYTVVNIPPEVFEEPYNLRTKDINKISEPYISEYIKQISLLLNNKGLTELYELYDVKKVEKYSYLVIIGFSFFDTSKLFKNLIIKVLPSFLLILLLIFLYFKLH